MTALAYMTNVFILYFAVIVLYPVVISLPILNTNIYEYFLDNLGFNINDGRVYLFFTLLIIGLGAYLAYRKVKQKKNMMQLDYVLNHLHYIADGHYDQRIPEIDNEFLSPVIASINHLVNSTVTALESQKKTEQTKDELIANVSHDIRTPLTSIIGYLDILNSGKYETQAQYNHCLKITQQKANTMKNLVEDLFLYTDSTQESYKINPIELPIELYLDQMAADFELQTSEKGIRIEVEVVPEELMVIFDPDKMARVFSNLISNAIKYGYGADRIRLIAYEDAPNQLNIFEVRNNGQVLEAGEEEKIFERSYRTEKSRNAKEPGSGLGLAIVKNMVTQHHGTITALVNNNETVFRIILPKEINGGNNHAQIASLD